LGVFDLFPGEEAALVKLLESAKTFESPGAADIREFLTAASDPEKPDPAWTIDVPRTIDAVRVMSVHKAKGLGFPAVILLQYAEPFIPPEFVLAPGDDAVRVLKLTKDLAASDPELAALYEDHRMRDTVDRLNALYVAMTRAEEELHVIGVKGSRGGFPFELLDGDALGVFGEKTRRERPAEERPEDKAGTHRLAEPFDLPPNTRPVRNFAGVRRGNLIHDVLSRTVYIEEGWRARIEAALREGGEGAGEAAETAAAKTAAALERLFSVPPLSGLFSRAEGRRILNEFTVCDAAGRALRMDRVVLDPGAATVIDYKTGGSPGGEMAVSELASSKKSPAGVIENWPGKSPAEICWKGSRPE
jgi:ATP-dependent helicase/nuclease subunit A